MKNLIQSILAFPSAGPAWIPNLSPSAILMTLSLLLTANMGALAQSSISEGGFQPDPSEVAGIIILSGKSYYADFGINAMLDFNLRATAAASFGLGRLYRFNSSRTYVGWEALIQRTVLGDGTSLCVPGGCPECVGANPPGICPYIDLDFESSTTLVAKATFTTVGKRFVSNFHLGGGYQFDTGKKGEVSGAAYTLNNAESFTINYGASIGTPISKRMVLSLGLDGMTNLGTDIKIVDASGDQVSFQRNRFTLFSPGLKLKFLL